MFQQINLNQMPNQSRLFKEYLANSDWRKENLGYEMLDLESDIIDRHKNLASQSFDRNGLSQVIENYMRSFGISEKSKLNLEKIINPECVCIVAGQQPALFGGPLYNYYKAITAIKIANQMESKTGKPFVPVFWNGSNDQDVDEGNRFYYLDKNRRMSKGALKELETKPLDRVFIHQEIFKLKSKLESEMSRVDFLDIAWSKLLPTSEDTIGTWQTRILNQIFGEKGLLILEPRILKKISKQAFSFLLEKEDQFINQIKINSEKLKNNNFEVQVDVDVSSRMMLYQKNAGRNRLTKQGTDWVFGKQKWSRSNLIDHNDLPDVDLTPDALGRPLWQDMILPVAAYIAGPGEIAYFHQLKGCYELFGMKMPLILPRESGTILEKNHLKLMNHFNISKNNFFEFKNWVKVPLESTISNFDLPAHLLSEWQEIAKSPEEKQIWEVFKSKLEKLNKKFYDKLISNRNNRAEIGNKQLQEWKDFVFPMNLTQERIYGILPLMARHGPLFLEPIEKEPYIWGKHFILTMNDG